MKSTDWHGTAGGYRNHNCRCDLCTNTHRIIHAAYVKKGGIFTGKDCLFLECNKPGRRDKKGFCCSHGNLIRRLLQSHRRDEEEIEFACVTLENNLTTL